MNFFAPMARYLSGELVGLGATRRPCATGEPDPRRFLVTRLKHGQSATGTVIAAGLCASRRG